MDNGDTKLDSVVIDICERTVEGQNDDGELIVATFRGLGPNQTNGFMIVVAVALAQREFSGQAVASSWPGMPPSFLIESVASAYSWKLEKVSALHTMWMAFGVLKQRKKRHVQRVTKNGKEVSLADGVTKFLFSNDSHDYYWLGPRAPVSQGGSYKYWPVEIRATESIRIRWYGKFEQHVLDALRPQARPKRGHQPPPERRPASSELPSDCTQLVDQLKSMVHHRQDSEVQAILRRHESAMEEPSFHAFARNLYTADADAIVPFRFLDVQGLKYACAVLEAPEQQRFHDDVDSILAGWVEQTPEVEQSGLSGYAELLEQLDRAAHSQEQEHWRMHDGRKFAMSKIVSNDPLQISCHASSYYQGLNTCDALGFELKHAWVATNGSIAHDQDPWGSLSLRKCSHRSVSNSLGSGEHRAANLAVSTLICCRDPANGYLALLYRRSAETATDPNGFHVLPAGMFEPSSVESCTPEMSRDLYSVRENVLREHLEECWGVREPKNNWKPKWYYEHFRTKELLHMLNTKEASLHLTGLAISLINLRPEICTLLMIHDTNWASTQLPNLDTNWEVESDPTSPGSRRLRIPIAWTDEAITAKCKEIRPENMVVPGAAAFWLGIRLARELVGKRS